MSCDEVVAIEFRKLRWIWYRYLEGVVYLVRKSVGFYNAWRERRAAMVRIHYCSGRSLKKGSPLTNFGRTEGESPW
jgi:hypothetical protein